MRRTGVVLCGGRSSRMGRPKALLPWRGRTLVETVVEKLREVVDEVFVVSSADLELPALPARVVVDREPALGPLAGIREGLHAVGSGLAFVASTDAPHLSPSFVRSMLARRRPAAVEIDGRVEPLGAVYDATDAPIADALIAEGRMRPVFLLEASGFERLSPDQVERASSLRGVNRPDEYLAFLRAEHAEGGVLELFGRAGRQMGTRRIEVPVGTLGEVLQQAEPTLRICEDGKIASPYLVSLNGRDFVRDPSIPIGTGDRVIVMDAGAGG